MGINYTFNPFTDELDAVFSGASAGGVTVTGTSPIVVANGSVVSLDFSTNNTWTGSNTYQKNVTLVGDNNFTLSARNDQTATAGSHRSSPLLELEGNLFLNSASRNFKARHEVRSGLTTVSDGMYRIKLLDGGSNSGYFAMVKVANGGTRFIVSQDNANPQNNNYAFTLNGSTQNATYLQILSATRNSEGFFFGSEDVSVLDGNPPVGVIYSTEGPLMIWSASPNSTTYEAIMKTYYSGIEIGAGVNAVDYYTIFNGNANDGIYRWMEDEDYFLFEDDVMLSGTESSFYGVSGVGINSPTGGAMQIKTKSGLTISGGTTIIDSLNINANTNITGSVFVSGTNTITFKSGGTTISSSTNAELTLAAGSSLIVTAGSRINLGADTFVTGAISGTSTIRAASSIFAGSSLYISGADNPRILMQGPDGLLIMDWGGVTSNGLSISSKVTIDTFNQLHFNNSSTYIKYSGATGNIYMTTSLGGVVDMETNLRVGTPTSGLNPSGASRFIGRNRHTAAPAGSLGIYEWDMSLYHSGTAPVFRVRYNDSGTFKIFDGALV